MFATLKALYLSFVIYSSVLCTVAPHTQTLSNNRGIREKSSSLPTLGGLNNLDYSSPEIFKNLLKTLKFLPEGGSENLVERSIGESRNLCVYVAEKLVKIISDLITRLVNFFFKSFLQDKDSEFRDAGHSSESEGVIDYLSPEKNLPISYRPTGILNHTADRCFMISSIQCLMACGAIQNIYLSDDYAICGRVTRDYHNQTNTSLRDLFTQQFDRNKLHDQEKYLLIKDFQYYLFQNLASNSPLLEMRRGQHDASEFVRLITNRIDPRITNLFSGLRFAISKCPQETCESYSITLQSCEELEISLQSETKELKPMASFLETLDEYFFHNVPEARCEKCLNEANRDYISFLSAHKCPTILNICFKRFYGETILNALGEFIRIDSKKNYCPIGTPPLTLFALVMKQSPFIFDIDGNINIRPEMVERINSLKINQKQKFFLHMPSNYDTEIFKVEMYRLNAIILHYGTLREGHYTALVRYGNRWFTCNDRHVSEERRDILEILKNFDFQSYILNVFYERVLTDSAELEEIN